MVNTDLNTHQPCSAEILIKILLKEIDRQVHCLRVTQIFCVFSKNFLRDALRIRSNKTENK